MILLFSTKTKDSEEKNARERFEANKEIYKVDVSRMDFLDTKISWLIATHGVFFLLLWNIFLRWSCFSVAISSVFLFVSLCFSLYAIKPVDVMLPLWKNEEDLESFNKTLCGVIEDNNKEADKKLYRFKKSLCVFIVALLIDFVIIVFPKVS